MYRSFLLILLTAVLGVRISHAAEAEKTYALKRLLLADSEAKAKAIPEDAGGSSPAFAPDLTYFNTAEFRAVVSAQVGKPIGAELLGTLATAITNYARSHDRLIVKVSVPNQNVSNGVLRLVVEAGTYRDITFQGNKWFSRKLLEERLGIRAGDEVRLSTLEEAANWLNTNPFRQVKVLINELPAEPGKATLMVGVQERRPYRVAFSYDNTGNEITGRNRYALALQFGNLWGADHQGSYQFLSTDDPHIYQAHVVDYRVPLASRHFLQLGGGYVLTNPTFNNGLLSQQGESIMANLRYTVPLRTGNEGREFFCGLSFKQTNNNLDFIGTEEAIRVLANKTDTLQFFTGLNLVKRDRHGGWALSLTANASPGNFNSRSTNRAYNDTRSGAPASYVYGSLSIQRLLSLYKGWDLMSRGIFQASSANLLASEQLSIGGSGSVRGYEENVYAGEDGFALNNELLAPPLRRPLRFLGKTSPVLETRFLGFLDVAKVRYHERFGSDINFAPLASVGLGARSSIGNNLSLTFDYGWQLTHLAQQVTQTKRAPLANRGHIKLVLAF